MIGVLPKSLEVDCKEYEINSDFRVALLIFQACNDNELNMQEKCRVCVECLYSDIPENFQKAYEKAVWFLDGGDMPKPEKSPKKMMDWEQDESIIFPALNKVAGYETREVDYLHWWSFLGLFNEVGEGLYSNVMSIRAKKTKGKKLDEWEKDFYKSHKNVIDLKVRYSAEEQEEIDYLNSLLN